MKGEVSKPLIVTVVVLVLAGVAFAFWKTSQPPEPDVKLPDISNMTMEEIQKTKQAEHDADAARGRQ